MAAKRMLAHRRRDLFILRIIERQSSAEFVVQARLRMSDFLWEKDAGTSGDGLRHRDCLRWGARRLRWSARRLRQSCGRRLHR